MKILIGICGIGKGHCSRQNIIINELLKRGHEVRILTYNDGVDFFASSNIKVYKVFVPIIMFKKNKINYLDFIKRNGKKLIPGYITNKKIFNKLKKEKFIPDVCISDYEPIVARFAYKMNKPLINIDQQSKFIYMNADEINGFSIFEEKNRMNLFFPKCNEKLIISFYKINSKSLPKNVKILAPIIRDEVKKNNKINKKKKVVVYFSKFIHIPIKQNMNEIFELFSKFEDYEFKIYISENSQTCRIPYKNIEIKKNDTITFAKDLGDACCAISTAGHTLISEALYCNIPTYVVPLPTFDQNYCAKFINDNNIGYASEMITYNNLKNFINNINYYVENINKCENLLKGEDSMKCIIREIEKYENNNKC